MFLRLIGFLLLIPTVSLADTAFPLQDVARREAIPLSTWQFQAEPKTGEVDWSTEEFRAQRQAWPTASVPGVWGIAPGKVHLPIPEQAGWYRSVIPLPDTRPDEEWSLFFLGVKYICDVFANGEYLGVHRGGYTPFEIDLPQKSGEVEIVIRVENRLSDRTIPKRVTGWEIYGGIDREIYLLRKSTLRPEDLFVQSFRDENGRWQLRIQAKTIGKSGEPIDIRLLNKGKTEASAQIKDWSDGIDVTLPLDAPELWSPENPHLYTLDLQWGKDSLRFPVGIRELEWKGGKLHLNGHPLWLQGFGQHEFFPGSGSSLSSDQRREDLRRMKENFSANAMRTGHYPHHPDLFNLADEIGLLLFTELPAWQNNPQVLDQPEIWDKWIEPQLTEMVLRHRNHPSVFGWGVLNEIARAHPHIIRSGKLIQNLDPTRGVAAVLASTVDLEVNNLTDFAARNLHYGWYHSRSVYQLRDGVEKNLAAANGRALWVAELGGMATPGRLGGGYSDKVRGTETYQDKMTRFGLQYILSRADDMAGISLWTWSDYERDGSAHLHGILSADRKPKLAAYTAVNLMRPPFVALAAEYQAVVPSGEQYKADLAVFARNPAPDKPVTLHWELRSPTEILQQGTEKLQLSEKHVSPCGSIRWTVPPETLPALHHIYLELRDEEQKRLHSQLIPFEAGGTTRPGVLRVPPPEDNQVTVLHLRGMELDVYPGIGLQIALAPGKIEVEIAGNVYSVQINEAQFSDLPWQN